MAFKKKDRQRIIDDYLSQSGRKIFSPVEFVEWLADKPDHEAYEMFYGMSDGEAAKAHRVAMARKLASGLRIVASVTETTKSQVVQISVREYPAFISPIAGRRSGGGYEPVDATDEAQIAEIRRQGASALRGWLARYRGAFEHVGVDLSPIEKIAASEDVDVAKSA